MLSIVLTVLLSAASPEPVVIAPHYHEVVVRYYPIAGTCNWETTVTVNGTQTSKRRPTPSVVTCVPLDQVLKDLKK